MASAPVSAPTPSAPEAPAPKTTEYAARIQKVREAMAAQDLTALVVTDPSNLFYLTGYNAWSFYMPQCLIVPVTGLPHLFARAMDAGGAHHTCDLPRERIHGYPEELIQRSDAHPYEWIAEKARELDLLQDLPGCRIGLESDSAFFTARDYLALDAALPQAVGVDGNELVNWVRVIKSPVEQEALRIAGAIARQSMLVALDAIRVGRRQCDVVGDIMKAQASGTAEYGGDYPAIVPMLPTGDAAGTPHMTWSDAKFVAGEATTIELAGVHQRYHVPLARTIMLGEPPERLADTAKVIGEGMQVTLDTIRDGVTGREVHAAFNDVISRHGLRKDSRIGYSIGIGYPPDWGEHTISLRASEARQLHTGMALHVILGMWMDGWGYELSEPILIQDDGVERLTDLPQELTIRR